MKFSNTPPPFYPCIQANSDTKMNLDSYVDMNPTTGPGIVMSSLEFASFASGIEAPPPLLPPPLPISPYLVPGVTTISPNPVPKPLKQTQRRRADSAGHYPKYHTRRQHASFIEKTRQNLQTAERARRSFVNASSRQNFASSSISQQKHHIKHRVHRIQDLHEPPTHHTNQKSHAYKAEKIEQNRKPRPGEYDKLSNAYKELRRQQRERDMDWWAA
ncbi:hypothetical protein AAMO2058_001402300 [Amorphochlora amoebiformis]